MQQYSSKPHTTLAYKSHHLLRACLTTELFSVRTKLILKVSECKTHAFKHHTTVATIQNLLTTEKDHMVPGIFLAHPCPTRITLAESVYNCGLRWRSIFFTMHLTSFSKAIQYRRTVCIHYNVSDHIFGNLMATCLPHVLANIVIIIRSNFSVTSLWFCSAFCWVLMR